MRFLCTKSPYNSLLNYSFWLLGRKAYTESELRTRLRRRVKKIKLENGDAVIAQVTARLLELNYINDAKILEDYFEYRLQSRPQGKYAFLSEMRRRGIEKNAASSAWERRSVHEDELAQLLIKKNEQKLKKLEPIARKRKTAALLASRGFSASTVWGVLDKG